MDLIIIGTGMYVCGKDNTDYGTILPAVLSYIKKNNFIKNIHIVGTKKKSLIEIKKKYKILSQKLKIKINIKFYPNDDNIQKDDYIKILKSTNKFCPVIISVPDHLHFKIVNDCMRHFKHTLIVKPFVKKYNEAQKILRIQKKNKLLGLVEFHKRLDRQNIIIKDLINNNKIGKILSFNIEYSQKITIPKNSFIKWVRNTNLIYYLGVHYIDLIYFFTQATPYRVSAVGQKNILKNNGVNVHDSIQLMLEWKLKDSSIFNSLFSLSWVDPEKNSARSIQNIKVIGTLGRIISDQKTRGLSIVNKYLETQDINPDFNNFYSINKNPYFFGYGIENVQSFLNDIENINKKKISNYESLIGDRSSFKDASISTLVAESATKSLNNNGNWVKIKK